MLIVEFEAPIVEGHFPDKRLTVRVSEFVGGSYSLPKVPDNLFDDRSKVVNTWVCIDKGISPSSSSSSSIF